MTGAGAQGWKLTVTKTWLAHPRWNGTEQDWGLQGQNKAWNSECRLTQGRNAVILSTFRSNSSCALKIPVWLYKVLYQAVPNSSAFLPPYSLTLLFPLLLSLHVSFSPLCCEPYPMLLSGLRFPSLGRLWISYLKFGITLQFNGSKADPYHLGSLAKHPLSFLLPHPVFI